MAASVARIMLFVEYATPKPIHAPTNMLPSTLKLMTPARWLTMSPRRAYRMGVPAAIMFTRITESSRMTFPPSESHNCQKNKHH